METRCDESHLGQRENVHAEAPAAACTLPTTAGVRTTGLSKSHTSSIHQSRCHSAALLPPADRLSARRVAIGRAGCDVLKVVEVRTGRAQTWWAGGSTMHL